MLEYNIVSSPLGEILLAAENGALIGVHLRKHGESFAPQAGWEHNPDAPVVRAAAAQLGEYFHGEREVFELPLAPAGTDFQRAVWKRISRIPFGKVDTYGRIAADLGRPGAVRAVGAATGRNPLLIVVPCHRVIGAGNTLTGYGGGLDRKVALLEFETARRLGERAAVRLAAREVTPAQRLAVG